MERFSKSESNTETPRRFLTRRRVIILIFIFFIAVPLFIYGRYIEPFNVEFHDVEVGIAGLPEGLDGFTIAHVTDMHCGRGVINAHVRRTFDGVISRNPDIVVITGDLVHKKHPAHEFAAGEVKRLAEKFPVFVIPGNHDRKAGLEKYAELIRKSGATDIAGRYNLFIKGSAAILIAGGSGSRKTAPDIDAILQNINREAQPTVFLIHNPDHFPFILGKGIDLVLAGHTHGGQVRLPLIGPLVDNIENGEYAAGLVRQKGTAMYVCRGIGWTGRFRLNCPPEVAFIVLRRK